MYELIRQATITAAKQKRCRIVQLSIQGDHVHLIVEANSCGDLARGMQSFQVSGAKRINTAHSRRGCVFADRYHAHVLRTPTEVRNALAYVLNNWRKHRVDSSWAVDPYSSGYSFEGWKERSRSPHAFVEPREYDPLVVQKPSAWLLTHGWKRVGPISAFEVPKRR